MTFYDLNPIDSCISERQADDGYMQMNPSTEPPLNLNIRRKSQGQGQDGRFIRLKLMSFIDFGSNEHFLPSAKFEIISIISIIK